MGSLVMAMNVKLMPDAALQPMAYRNERRRVAIGVRRSGSDARWEWRLRGLATTAPWALPGNGA